MSTGRRQHTIPRFYLEQFFPGWCYRHGAVSPRYHRKAKNVAVHIDYYGGPEDDFKALDKWNSFIESKAAPVLWRLVYNTTSITRNDWITLSYCFANLYVRTPAFHESMRWNFENMTVELNQLASDMMAALEKGRAEGKEMSLPDVLGDDTSPRFAMPMNEWNELVEELDTEQGRLRMTAAFYKSTREVAKCVQRMSLFILDAPGGLFFVTTDRPLLLLSMSSGSTLGAGWENGDAFAMLPLDPKRFVVMLRAGSSTVRRKDLSAHEVQFWNSEMMKYANAEVYSKYPYDMASDWMHRRGQWAPPKEKRR
jgi:hypothetical protein